MTKFRICLIVKLILFNLIIMFHTVVAQVHLQHMEEGDVNFSRIVEKTETHYDSIGRGKGLGYKQFKRWQYWTNRSLDSEGNIKDKSKIHETAKSFRNTASKKSFSFPFIPLGPTVINNTSNSGSNVGRITWISVDTNNPSHILAASPTGGVWKTTDLGTSWTAIFDDQNSLLITCVEISPHNSNLYFVGTASSQFFISADAGLTWDYVSLYSQMFERINVIKSHPTIAGLVFVGTRHGLFKTHNNGQSWSEVYPSLDIMDIEFNPANNNIIYASGYGGLIKSINTGSTFNPVNLIQQNIGFLMMAVTPDEPDFLYVLNAVNGGFEGLMLSADAGDTYILLSDDSCNCNNILGQYLSAKGGQAPRDMDIIVNPSDKSTVHVGGIFSFKSTDTGQHWTRSTAAAKNQLLPYIHVDVDILLYAGQRIYAGTDGGIFYSDDEFGSFTDITTGLDIRQFYRLGVSATMTDRISGGSQDNGSTVFNNGNWNDFAGGDGMETFIDYQNPAIIFSSSQYGNLSKTEDGGFTNSPFLSAPGSGNWVTPLEQDPIQNDVLYQGKKFLYKFHPDEQYWERINHFFRSGNVSELKISPLNNDKIYMSYQSDLYKTTNGGEHWINISPTSGSFINYIFIHPQNDDRVLSVNADKIYESSDGGSTWTDITIDLPDVGFESCVYMNDCTDAILISTGIGIFKKTYAENHWDYMSTEMPAVRVTEMEIQNGFLYASTYGRGIWKKRLDPCECPPVNSICNDNDPCTFQDKIISDCECAGLVSSCTIINENDIIPVECGLVITNNAGTINAFENYNCVPFPETGTETIYRYTAVVDGSFTALLLPGNEMHRIYVLGSLSERDCIGTGGTSSSTFNFGVKGISYYIVVESTTTDPHAFIIDTDCDQLDCDAAIELTCGEPYSGSTVGADSFIDQWPCDNSSNLLPGPEVVHSFISHLSQEVITVNISTGFSVHFIDVCDPRQCLIPPFQSNINQEYHIVVDSENPAGGPYEITVEYGSSDCGILDCENANLLQCGIPYSFINDGSSQVSGYGNCVPYPEPGPDKAFMFVPPTSGLYQLSIFNHTGNFRAYQMESCDPLTCVSAIESGFNQTLTMPNVYAGVPVFISIETELQGVTYDLILDCAEDICPDTLVTTEPILNSNFYQAIQLVQSGSAIPINNDVSFVAEVEIELKPNFTVEQGAIFHAFIDYCEEDPNRFNSDNSSKK